VFVSTELIAIVVSSIGVVVTVGIALFSGLAWMVRRIDATEGRLGSRVDAVEEKLSSRIGAVEEKLTKRIDAVEEKLTKRIDAVEEKLSDRIDAMGQRIDAMGRELTEVKVSVARWEGPRPRLMLGG